MRVPQCKCTRSIFLFLYRNTKKYDLQIWDTAGDERYKSIVLAYYQGTSGFILMFDLTKKESFTDLAKK